MRAGSTSIVVILGYALLLFAPGILPFNFGFGGYVFLAVAWFVAALWLVWQVRWRDYAVIMSGIILLALLASPINAIMVGCYAFNQCP